MCVLNFLALFFLIHLISFHIELEFKNLTTYEFLKLKEGATGGSKIVTKITDEMRDEYKREQEERIRIMKEQQ